ncbi:MAG: glycosyltransferase family 4 protein [Armatimonadetes bacterium]|nr:glycosyltransferase family 4 protein [Armatimonadota bacterium]MDE2205687.1 glycosyltransferase family 4 protein [Armatimonadota bacterium]
MIEPPTDDGAAGPDHLRILHLASSLRIGGLEQFVVRLAAYQRSQAQTSEILTFRDGSLRDAARSAGLNPVVVQARSRAVRVVAAAVKMRRFRPSIIHAHNPTTLHYARIGARVAGAALVLTDHGQGVTPGRTASESEWRSVQAIAAVSSAVAERHAGRRGSLVRVIPNGVASSGSSLSREAARERLGLGEELAAIIVARIDGAKGHDTLLRALALLPPESRVLAIAAGDGARRAEMEQLAAELALNGGRIRFLGARTDVPELLAAGDIFVLPSLSEGMPLSVLEAMAAGLPVLASRVGGLPDLVADGETGRLLEPGDATQLAAALQSLEASPALRMQWGCNGRHRVERQFSFSAMADAYGRLYREALAMRSRVA